jgi:CcmD family protein
MNYLYAAYIATWVIHIGYLWTLVGRYRHLNREMKDLNRR